MRYHCSGGQLGIILAVVRATYGFNKESRSIGIAYLALLTGRKDKRRVARDVASLISRRVLTVVQKPGYNHSRTLMLNPDFNAWVWPKLTIPLWPNQTIQGMAQIDHLIKKGKERKAVTHNTKDEKPFNVPGLTPTQLHYREMEKSNER